METDKHNEDFQRLHHLIAGTGDIKGFIDGMTRYAATSLSRSTGTRVECAVTLHRRKRSVTIAGSSEDAILLDGVEQALHEGPCMESLQTLKPMLLTDTATDQRWARYSKNVAAAGASSVLGVPLSLGQDASAALNFFASDVGVFTATAIEEAVVFADMAGQALKLALRIAAADLLAEDLKEAMKRRTTIDVACGLIMSQNHCSQEEAYAFLLKASQNRNEKVHDVADKIIAGLTGAHQPARTFFDD